MPTPAVAEPLRWRAGDPARVTIRVVDADGEPVPLGGSTWTAQVRQDRERDVLATMTTDATDADDGALVFTLTGAQTRAIREAGGSSPHIDVEGSAHGTLVAMRAVIERDVTRVPDGSGGIVEPTGGLGDVLDLMLTGTTVEVVAQSVGAFLVTTIVDGGTWDSNYGGTTAIDGGTL